MTNAFSETRAALGALGLSVGLEADATVLGIAILLLLAFSFVYVWRKVRSLRKGAPWR